MNHIYVIFEYQDFISAHTTEEGAQEERRNIIASYPQNSQESVARQLTISKVELHS